MEGQSCENNLQLLSLFDNLIKEKKTHTQTQNMLSVGIQCEYQINNNTELSPIQ